MCFVSKMISKVGLNLMAFLGAGQEDDDSLCLMAFWGAGRDNVDSSLAGQPLGMLGAKEQSFLCCWQYMHLVFDMPVLVMQKKLDKMQFWH